MEYKHIVSGEFLARPNRFTAYVDIGGRQETVHVKNTGRCKELLTEHAEIYLEQSDNSQRKTKYDLVAVRKGQRLINMDSQAPNKVVEEWLLEKKLFSDLVLVRPETTYKNSRFDFYIETEHDKIFMEVKGVTLEQDGVVMFPDAPSERAVKHVRELIEAKKEGYKAYILFLIQMKGVRCFMPNEATHEAFAHVLAEAKQAGVELLAYDSHVWEEGISVGEAVPIHLREDILPKGDLRAIATPLLSWYDKQKRVLPWREEPTPYRVWISEIMLQQTRVEAVKPYFERFLQRLPDISSLAQVEEDVLLKLWEGLGYYNRARNLQKAAIRIMEEYDGRMPDNYEELLKLCGIGSYTAGAIASIAYQQPVPAVDGNVLRVIARLRMDEGDILSQSVKKRVEQDLLEAMPQERPGDFNQAMMEIGAMVCIPNGMAKCDICPLAQLCLAREHGRVTEFPKKTQKKPRTIEKKTILVIRDADKAAIRKRPMKGLLAGMYEFPSLEGHYTMEGVTEYCRQIGLHPIRVQQLTPSTHIFTHKEWHMIGYAIRVDELVPLQRGQENKDWLFVDPGETEDKYPIPAAFAAYTGYLNIKLGNEKYNI